MRRLESFAALNLNKTIPVAFSRMFLKCRPCWYIFWVISITEIRLFRATTENNFAISSHFEHSIIMSSRISKLPSGILAM